MSEEALRAIIKEFNLPVKVCPNCRGEGNVTEFCGHDMEVTCQKCEGKGYIAKKKPRSSRSSIFELVIGGPLHLRRQVERLKVPKGKKK